MSALLYSSQVELGEDGSIVRIPSLDDQIEHVAYVQNPAPLSNSHPAFRVKIERLAQDAVVGIGICAEPIVEPMKSEEKESSDRPRDAIIYYSDNGDVSSPARSGRGQKGSKYSEGDTVTLVIEQLAARKSLICIIKNDAIEGRRWVTLKAEELLPTINVWWGSAELHVEWLSSSVPSLSMNNLNQWMCSENVKLQNDQFTYTDGKEHEGIIQAPHPFKEGTSLYFEATVTSLGKEDEGGPFVGLTPSTMSGFPGKEVNTISYDAAEGKIHSNGQESKGKNLGEAGKCQVGDVLGCGFLVVEDDKPMSATQQVVAFFVKNRSLLQHCNIEMSIGGFYPTAAFTSEGSSLRISVEATPPELPDKDKWIAAAKKAMMFPGLGSFEGGPMPSESHTHEEGVTSGNFRFSEAIGCPTSDTIRPQKDLFNKDDEPASKLLQLLRTITPSEPYFAVKIVDLSDKSVVCVGVSRDGQSCGTIPGSLVDSAGYASSGDILLGNSGHFNAEKFEKDDEIGVFVDFLDLTKVVQFTKNGRLMGQSVIKGSNKDIFPSLGFAGKAPTVTVSWPTSRPQPPPRFTKDKFENWLKSPGLVMKGDTLQKEKKTRRMKGEILLSPQSLSQSWSYFEVEIRCRQLSTEAKRADRAPVVGLTNCMTFSKYKNVVNQKENRDVRYFCHINSVGYMDYLSHELVPLKQYVKSGDRIGWGVIYPSAKNIPSDLTRQVVVVFLCVNGQIVYHRPMEQPGGGLFPVITLYKYGEEATLLVNSTPPATPDLLTWIEEADAFRIEVDKQRKAAEFVLFLPYLMRPILPSKKKYVRRGQYKQTAADRRARPATPSKRPDNHLKKHAIYIHCDPERYNEATHIQSRLDTKGFVTSLLPQERLNASGLVGAIDEGVSGCAAVVCCMGPEISETKHMGQVLQMAQKWNKPVLPFILEKLRWPPEGALQNEWQKLVMHKIETSGDFDWAIEQIEEKTLALKEKGYNGKEIRVAEGKAAKMLYTDAQKGNKTANERSDPNALKKAIADADRQNVKSIGSDNFQKPKGGGAGDQGAQRSISFSNLQSNKKIDPGPARPQSSHGGRVQQSKACIIL